MAIQTSSLFWGCVHIKISLLVENFKINESNNSQQTVFLFHFFCHFAQVPKRRIEDSKEASKFLEMILICKSCSLLLCRQYINSPKCWKKVGLGNRRLQLAKWRSCPMEGRENWIGFAKNEPNFTIGFPSRRAVYSEVVFLEDKKHLIDQEIKNRNCQPQVSALPRFWGFLKCEIRGMESLYLTPKKVDDVMRPLWEGSNSSFERK